LKECGGCGVEARKKKDRYTGGWERKEVGVEQTNKKRRKKIRRNRIKAKRRQKVEREGKGRGI
jgi:hypothetical protein